MVYESVTEGVRVSVEPEYLEDQSSPDEGYFFWSYTVEISNDTEGPVVLRTRLWQITDAVGNREEVRGPGVVGQTPRIDPGETFTYTSGCPLRTPSGIMVGSYQMVDRFGRLFDVAIPAFSLDCPFSMPTVN
ncbi:MAG: Co2+/Mg2+ efflux protein ApaG [Alphaproteobacteria bacterium]|nr:Co2+/Mg2+ efflux protein ApaG [Alphaproteobacteria bacterium]